MDEVLEQLSELGLVPVVEVPEASGALALADALTAGGLPCLEVTFRTPAAAAAISAISRDRPAVLVGAGTVLSPAQVDVAADAGARFVVSPGFDAAVVARCRARSISVMPGVVTPTEVQAALAQGCGTLKFFPAEASGGAGYLRALIAPFGDLRLIPSGGIDPTNLSTYFAIPQVVAVGGSWIAPRSLLDARDFAAVEARTREGMEMVRSLRPRRAPVVPGVPADG